MGNSLKIFTDGGSRGNPGPAAGAYVVLEDSKIIYEFKKYFGVKTNNEAEYLALLEALTWLNKNQLNYANYEIFINMDSQLVVNQLNGLYKIKDQKLITLSSLANKLIKSFNKKPTFIFIKRELNKQADKLVNICLDENS